MFQKRKENLCMKLFKIDYMDCEDSSILMVAENEIDGHKIIVQ